MRRSTSCSWPTMTRAICCRSGCTHCEFGPHRFVDGLNAGVGLTGRRLRGQLLVRQGASLEGRRSVFGGVEVGVGAARLDGGGMSRRLRVLEMLASLSLFRVCCCAQTPTCDAFAY